MENKSTNVETGTTAQTDANTVLVADKIKWEDLRDGDIYEQEQHEGEWVKGTICHHWRGSLMIELIEGRLKGKRWYLFPDLKRLRRVVD